MPWSPSISMGITEPEHKQDDKVQNVIRGSEELPVAKDTTTPIRNRMAGISAAGMESCTTPVRKHMAIAIWILAWPKQPMKPLTQIWPV